MTKLGSHILVDVSDIEDIYLIEKLDHMKLLVIDIVEKLKLNVVNTINYQFCPVGCSICILLQESHLSLHTYPEYNSFSLDLYTCNLETDLNEVEEIIYKFLGGKCKIMKKIIDR